MKILHICTTDYGGAPLCCLRIHQSLIQQGIDSKVIVYEKTTDTPEVYQYGGKLKYLLYRIISKLLELCSFRITALSKFKLIKREKDAVYTLPVSTVDLTKCKWVDWADVIHLHWVNSFLDYPSFFTKVKKPIIWTLHDENLFCGVAHYRNDVLDGNEIEMRYQQMKQNLIGPLHNINIVFLSNYMKDSFKYNPIVCNKRQFVINNSVDDTKFNIFNKREMRHKYRIPLESIVFVFLSYDIFDLRKGLDVLVASLKNNPMADKIMILAIGGNSKKKEIPSIVKNVGNVKDPMVISELLSCGDYYALPSYQEAFAQSPMEAMACGLPVIAFPCSGTEELINERNGFVCRDFTQEALEEGIKIILSRKYNSIEIRKDVITRFSPQKIANKYIEAYKTILST